MSELSRNSTIKELIDSKKPLKILRTMLTVRDTTIKEVFNGLGYFYDAKLKQWVNENGSPQTDLTFQQAMEKIKGDTANIKPRKPRTNSKLIETNRTPEVVELSIPPNNSKLIETNSNLNVEVLNAIGISQNELAILKEMIYERMQHGSISADVNDIYNEVARLKSRKRKNKTFYISEDLTQDVVDFADELNVKISQLVEVALIEMLAKYKTIIKTNSN